MGAGNAGMLGVYLQRGVCILTMILLPLLPLLFAAEAVLVGIGQ